MVGIDAHFVLYGGDESWTINFPFCLVCDA
jgi:hypothetical protein